VSDAVISIRQSKLPDPKILGNSGSFFKNPEITKEHFEKLQQQHPNVVAYSTSTGNMKLAAGWMIEQCGWKGKVVGNTGSHKDQALVLVNYGGATGSEVYQLALDIKKSVFEKFGVEINTEVNIY
jgi:UDP-N-acetylmuramate dehydrogenase